MESRTIDEVRERIQELRKPSALTRMLNQRIQVKDKQGQCQDAIECELLPQTVGFSSYKNKK